MAIFKEECNFDHEFGTEHGWSIVYTSDFTGKEIEDVVYYDEPSGMFGTYKDFLNYYFKKLFVDKPTLVKTIGGEYIDAYEYDLYTHLDEEGVFDEDDVWRIISNLEFDFSKSEFELDTLPIRCYR